MVRIGIIGAGSWAKKVHAPAFHAAGAKIVGVYSRTPLHAHALAQAYGARAYSTYEALLEDVDAVTIATPDNTHAPYATQAAARGVHVLVEKPLGRNVAEAQALLEAVQKAGVIGMTALTARGDPAVAHAHDLLTAGALGTPYYLRGLFHGAYLGDPTTPTPWRAQAQIAGPGGVVGDLGPHLFDLARHLTGLEFCEVLARTQVCLERTPPATNPDAAAILARMDGLDALLSLSRVHVGEPQRLELELQGSAGALKLQLTPKGGFLWRAERPGVYARLEPPSPPTQGWGRPQFVVLARRFLEGIRQGTPPQPSLEDGLAAQRVVDAAVHSATQGAWRAV